MNKLITQTTEVAVCNAKQNRKPWRIVFAQADDIDVIISLFGALHTYNASLDAHFALSDDWEALLRQHFSEARARADKLWLLVKGEGRAVGLLIASVHTDSPMFRHSCWVEIEALYVAESHRGQHIAQGLLERAYNWAIIRDIRRVQLYVTASNVRARALYTDQDFAVTQAIMRKSL
jgi:GNAT superfamily N-acetyltransferase